MNNFINISIYVVRAGITYASRLQINKKNRHETLSVFNKFLSIFDKMASLSGFHARPCSCTYCMGDCPKKRMKVWVKWLWSAKPQSMAMVEML